MTTRLTIECTEDSLAQLRPGVTTIAAIKAVTELARAQYGIAVDFVIYQGLRSRYGGGRMMDPPPEEVVRAARALNGHGVPFALALNGGLTLPGPIDLGDADRELLETLAALDGRHGVRNKVVVTHEGMLPLLRSRHPSLEVIASCIQSLNPRSAADYNERLASYDYVVPLSQHGVYDCLKRYATHAHKLILLLTMRCGRPELAKCYAHYASVEEHFGGPAGRKTVEEAALPAFEPSALPDDAHGCILRDEFGPRVSLLDREEDLSQLLGMGVNKFKVARLHALREAALDRLLWSARRWGRSS